jgi:phosphopantothenoylcysteine synthetase/decarboxylase
MTFRQEEQLPYKKWAAPCRKVFADKKKSRKQSRDHAKLKKKEVDELQTDDNAEDNVEDDEEDDGEDNDEYNDEEWPLTMEEKQLMGMDYVSQEEV